MITLRPIEPDDLPILFAHQLDDEANFMAGFTAVNPQDRIAFMERWDKILADDNITTRTILYGEQVAGSILSHNWFGDLEISYWIDKALWGNGIATEAVKQFLQIVTERPIYGRVAHDNIGSKKVMLKNGFTVTATDKGYANARQAEIEELILKLG